MDDRRVRAARPRRRPFANRSSIWERRKLRYDLRRREERRGSVDRALRKTRSHVADIARLAEMTKKQLHEGRFEDARACLQLIEEHASATGKDALGWLLEE